MMTIKQRVALAAAAAALVGLGAGCTSTKEGPAPSTTTPSTTVTTSTTAPEVAPSEKNIDPSGANKFTPTHIVLPPPPTGRAH